MLYVSKYEHGENCLGTYPATYNHMSGWPPSEIGSWTRGSMNMGNYSNPEVFELLDQGKVEINQTKRKEIYDEIQAINAEELPFVHLYSTRGARAYNTEFCNLESVRALISWKAYDDVWLTKVEPVEEELPEVSEEIEERISDLEESNQNMQSQISDLESAISDLESEIEGLGAPSGGNTVAYVSIGIAIIAIVIAVYFDTKTS